MHRITRWSWAFALGAIVLGLLAAAPIAAQAQGAPTPSAQAEAVITFTTDKTGYVFPSDTEAIIDITGLSACVGQSVEVGFFANLQSPAQRSPLSTAVNGQGQAHAQVPLPTAASSDFQIGVRGVCVPNGGALSAQRVDITHGDPPWGPVSPPNPLPEGVTLTTDKSVYVWPRDDALTITVTGLSACRGLNIAVFLASVEPERVLSDRDITVPVDANGRANARLPLTGLTAGNYIPLVRTVCSGLLVLQQPIEVRNAALVPPPGPPDTGSGVAGSESSLTWWVVGAGLVVLGVGGVVVSRSR